MYMQRLTEKPHSTVPLLLILKCSHKAVTGNIITLLIISQCCHESMGSPLSWGWLLHSSYPEYTSQALLPDEVQPLKFGRQLSLSATGVTMSWGMAHVSRPAVQESNFVICYRF